MIEVGLKHTSELTVTDTVTAITISSGDMPVLATPISRQFAKQSIIGATKERPVIEVAEAPKIQFTIEEVARLEALTDATGIDTRGGWEHSME